MKRVFVGIALSALLAASSFGEYGGPVYVPYGDMVFVEGGTFQMGGDEDEMPVHTVTVSSFYMSAHEVTQSEYYGVMRENPSWFSGNWDNPVECVSWYDAIEYCNALSLINGLTPCYRGNRDRGYTCDFSADGYRLPTEAEWEYAARGGKKDYLDTRYSGSDNLSRVAWYGYYDEEDENRTVTEYTTMPVERKLPNELGLYDMSGNVWEWCWDWYGGYTSAAQTNPHGASSGSFHVNRGGSWGDFASNCRVARRGYDSPSYSHYLLGFRVVRSSSKK